MPDYYRDPERIVSGAIDGPPSTSPQASSGRIGDQGAVPPPAAGPDLASSNQVLRDHFARNPVVPNEPSAPIVRDQIGPTLGDLNIGDKLRSAANAVVGNSLVRGALGLDSPPGSGGLVSSAQAAGVEAPAPAVGLHGRPTFVPQSDQSQSVQVPSREPVITNAALTPRAGPARDTIADANQVNRGELNIIRAREAQAQADNTNQMRADGRVAQANYDLGTAQNNARFDKFRAQNGADVVLGGNGRARRPYNDAAASSAAALEAARGEVRSAVTAANPQRNYVQDAVAQNQAANGSLAALEASKTGQVDRANKVVTGALDQQKLAQSKQMTDLTSVLATSNDPAARQRASDAILALHGKDTSGRYRVVHAAGGSGVAADGITPIKYPDRVVIHDTQTGKYDVVGGESGGGQAKAAPPENHVLALRQDPKKYKARFEAKYGPGSADQYLQQAQ